MRRWITQIATVVMLVMLLNFGEYSFVISERAAVSWWNWRFRELPAIAGDGFQVKIAPSLYVGNKDIVHITQDYISWLDDYFGISPPRPLVIATDTDSLNRAVGGQYSLGTSGAYQAGVVLISLPPEPTEEQIAASALLHELGHHYVHYMARGNYPIWYSEGIAQLVELKLLSYRWFDGIEKYDYYIYSVLEINNSFYSLQDQVSAYRQALELAILIEDLGGGYAHRDLLQALGKGFPFDKALQLVVGLNQEELFALWSWGNITEGAN